MSLCTYFIRSMRIYYAKIILFIVSFKTLTDQYRVLDEYTDTLEDKNTDLEERYV